MKAPVEFFDRDFLDNKIEIGDKVIFEAPGYRHFVIGTVVTKAPKSCQVEYINDWNYEGVKEVARQGYGQIIKYPDTQTKTAKWEISCDGYYPYCTNCSYEPFYANGRDMRTKYCPNCGAQMFEKEDR